MPTVRATGDIVLTTSKGSIKGSEVIFDTTEDMACKQVEQADGKRIIFCKKKDASDEPPTVPTG